ncbi:hypothetical protein SY88_06055 [Clostridiales bacterium PH28_bin88]|nr:hypothetical protein SY88_06055 [Clostridiales bacterium PH28_bin88]
MGFLRQMLGDTSMVLVDTNCLIYYLEDGPGSTMLEEDIFRPISEGKLSGMMSVITLLEVLVKPLKEGRNDVVEDYLETLTTYPNLIIMGVGNSLVVRAAQIRAKHGLKTPDAIIAATALEGKADVLLTNDPAFKALEPAIRVLLLSDIMS